MSRRTNSPDTDADKEIHACIKSVPATPFVVTAGAGSGKTTSLIKAMDRVIAEHGATMLMKKQKVACITYTEVAANEIREDVNADALVHVSTIHSFYWTIASSFQADIKVWLRMDLQRRIDELVEKARNFGQRVRQNTRDNNKRDQERLARHLEEIEKVTSFRYGMGSDYPKGILGHEDIIQLADHLLKTRPLFRRLVALNYPFVFIDESQDTFEEVVESFRMVEAQMRGRFCIGFFGDPMQKIYLRGSGSIGLEDGWKSITKPENFRSAQSILHVANAIRAQGDGLKQERGLHEELDGTERPVEGSARIFILPKTMNRNEALAKVRAWCAAADADDGWVQPELAVKILVIVHRIAAKRLGWDGIFAALSERAPDSIKQGLLDGTGWPVQPFLGFVLPLVAAMQNGNEFEAMNILRARCPRLAASNLAGKNGAHLLRELREAKLELVRMMNDESCSIRDVAMHLRATGLLALDERLERVLGLKGAPAEAEGNEADGGLPSDLPVLKLLDCPAPQLTSYGQYLSEGSPFATQHGVKGAQFDRVLVVMDEEENDYRLYDYEKVLGDAQASAADRAAFANGEDNTWSRTLRLLYVCCTRAKRGLALVFFVADPAATATHIVASGIFPEGSVITQDLLTGDQH
ncbi:UvrD-helicase domain-containing protein [Bordetella sp. N]|uniref:UvrD-helicase domain-containing protein n=1 Tax=Bordetella sp. N TaxID=1746199 RepID=UPI00070CDD50|nr:UvrD-helicase domain-containing protein [Bordetella sp. N]ALM81834.1 AAA family ATPase [Bordetella sp. N]